MVDVAGEDRCVPWTRRRRGNVHVHGYEYEYVDVYGHISARPAIVSWAGEAPK